MAVTRIWWDGKEKAWFCLDATDIANVPAAATALDSVVAQIVVGTTLIVINPGTLYKWNGEAFAPFGG